MSATFATKTVESVTVAPAAGLSNQDRRFGFATLRLTSREHADLLLDEEPFIRGPVKAVNELRLALNDLAVDGELVAVLDGHRVRLTRGLNVAS